MRQSVRTVQAFHPNILRHWWLNHVKCFNWSMQPKVPSENSLSLFWSYKVGRTSSNNKALHIVGLHHAADTCHARVRKQRDWTQRFARVSTRYLSPLPNNLALYSLVCPHLHTRAAHLCSGPACTVAQRWPWPGSATAPSTSSAQVRSAIQRNTVVFLIPTPNSWFKARLCLCTLRRWRLKSTSVHSPGKEKKTIENEPLL